MTDLDGDEALKWNAKHADWDESWIPYDAYMTYCNNDRGEKHLCDDEISVLLQAIRNKIGKKGRLTVVVDACHSGDATCGNDSECVRGVDVKFCIPRSDKIVTSPIVVDERWLTISACRPYQLSSEIKDIQVGKLTFALYNLGNKCNKLNNKQLEDVLTKEISKYKSRINQDPMVRGKK